MALPAPNRIVDSVRDAFIAALLVGVLGFFFLALRTEIAPGGLALSTRWGLWFSAIAIVFVIRLALNLFLFKANRPVRTGPSTFAKIGASLPDLSGWTGTIMLVVAIALPFLVTTFLPAQQRHFIDLMILILTYVMLGWGLNIVVGLAGLLDLGFVAFYAIGAYSFALLAHYFDFSFWMALPVAGILAAFWGMILGFPVLRLRGDYLAIVTLAFGEIIRVVLLN